MTEPQLRPEVRGLVDAGRLGPVRADADLARRRLATAEEHLESGRVNRRDGRDRAAASAFYEALWYALSALLAALGLRIVAHEGEGQHAVLMDFGGAELRESSQEREAADKLHAARSIRNQQMYRDPTVPLGSVPKLAVDVVAATRRRLDSWGIAEADE